MGAPPRVDEGELRQLETGELVRALARASPGDEDVPAILCKHMPDTGLVADTNEPRRLPALRALTTPCAEVDLEPEVHGAVRCYRPDAHLDAGRGCPPAQMHRGARCNSVRWVLDAPWCRCMAIPMNQA